MSKQMCPGQDTRFWKEEDIFEIPCPVCRAPVEFMKDDTRRMCKVCASFVGNPKMGKGCAQWCEAADICLGMKDRK